MLSQTDRGKVQAKRSTRLKFAVWYLALVQQGGALILYPFVRQTLLSDARTSTDFWFIVIFALVSWVLYGVWMHRNWARYPLLVLLLISFFSGLGDVLQLNLEGVAYLTFAAADKIAFDELQKASGLKLPWFLSWLS
jgi:hypothetical protein